MPGLKEIYRKQVVPGLLKDRGYQSIMQVPRLQKVVINIGAGEAIANAKVLEAAEKDLAAIAGQHPVITKARRSISAFKLRAGMPIGIKVTLRGDRMFHFLDKLINVTLPRIREFQGIPADSFDGYGNYTLGLKDQTVFPEINFEEIDKQRGIEICIVTTARTDEEGKRLLEMLGVPFSKD